MAFEVAFKEVEKQFEIESLLPEQKDSIEAFFKERNLFVNLPTGYGKSLIFQSIPIVADIVNGKPRSSSLMLVISPLTALMNDQADRLNNLGIPAISMVDLDDSDIIQQVIDGLYVVVYCSPEYLLSSTGRDILSDPTFQSKLIGVAIDEAHCISQWGLSRNKQGSVFRKWYGCLGELRSLIPEPCHLIILTATATTSTKKEILESLHLERSEVHFIEQSPNKDNLFYSKEYMDKNQPLENQLGTLIKELQRNGIKTERTIIYCQTRKQCSVLYRMFEVHLSQGIYNGKKSPKNQIVQMFHAGSPKPVKEFISHNMAQNDGHIRVLISTVAFGMGVDCKEIRRVVHFGPPKTVESYVQECGRAGRDGKPSCCVLLFNGLTSVHCDETMKAFLESEKCLRKNLMSHFGFDKVPTLLAMHECCINCAKKCDCENCGKEIWSPFCEFSECKSPGRTLCRMVNSEEKNDLKQELLKFQKKLRQKNLESMVTCPNILLEFNVFHINQVLDKCHQLFSIRDIIQHVEIWRHSYAVQILKILKEIFADIDIEFETLEEEDFNVTQHSDWSQIRDDSSLLDLLDTNELEDISSLMDSTLNSDKEISNSSFHL